MEGHKIYTFSIVQAAIVLFFGILGLVLYVNTNPLKTMIMIVIGFAASFIFLVACHGVKVDSPLFSILFREW